MNVTTGLYFSAPRDYTSTTVEGRFIPGGPTSINISVSTDQDVIVEGELCRCYYSNWQCPWGSIGTTQHSHRYNSRR